MGKDEGPLSATSAVLRFAWVVIGGLGGSRVQADVCTGARCVAGLKFFVSCPGGVHVCKQMSAQGPGAWLV